MNILVVSDAHGCRDAMTRLLRTQTGFDCLCFLGDCDRDADYLRDLLARERPRADFYAVSGNCDFLPAYAPHLTAQFENARVFLTHGHHYRVKQRLDLLAAAALERDCAFALYGHTHRAADETDFGVRLINPGALREGCYALLTLGPGRGPSVRLCTLER